MSRIILVNPPLPEVDIRAPKVATTAGMMPPMGLLALAGYLREVRGEDVRLLDLQVYDDPFGKMREVARDERPLVVGITSCLFTFYDALRVAESAKEGFGGTHVVLGGHHVSVFPAETAGHGVVDSAVFGEGELTLGEIIDFLNGNGKEIAGTAGVAARDGAGKVVTGPDRGLIRDLDSLPMTDRSFLEGGGYTWVQDRGRKSAIIFSGRGCPFKCSFCFNVSRSVRLHSVGYVVEEMSRCAGEGYGIVNFYDETFNITRKRTMELAAGIREAGLGVEWTFRGRCDVMDDELARELAGSGCVRINFGIESGTDEVLKVYRKQITVEDARRAVESASRAGIEPAGYFIIGAPGESRGQCLETIRFACSLPLGQAQFMILFPLPGTEIYERALAEGGFEDDYLRKWAAGERSPLRLRLWNTGLDEAELIGLMQMAYKKFYLNPRFIARQLRRLRSLSELSVYVRAGLSLVGYVLGGKRKKA